MKKAATTKTKIANLAILQHCSINKYLHQFNIVNSPECECQDGHGTVEHYLLKCEIYEEEREALRKKVRAQGSRVEKLLDAKIIAHTLKFIEHTQRLNF